MCSEITRERLTAKECLKKYLPNKFDKRPKKQPPI